MGLNTNGRARPGKNSSSAWVRMESRRPHLVQAGIAIEPSAIAGSSSGCSPTSITRHAIASY